MNAEIKDAFLSSLVTRACYADIRPQSNIKEILQSSDYQSGMTDSMAQYFTKHFAFVDSSLDSPSGYDAVLFKNTDSQELYLGNRGTQALRNAPLEIWNDLVVADIGGIVGTGTAWRQVAAMEEFYRTVINPLVQSGSTLNVAGHSLGGHLSTMLRLMHPESVDSVSTYNGAGVGLDYQLWISDPDSFKSKLLDLFNGVINIDFAQSTIDFLQNALSDITGLDGLRNNIADSAVTNYYVAEWLNLVINAGTTLGSRIPVATDAPLDTLGHGMGGLSDALLVVYVMSSIDDSLDMAKINKIIEAASNNNALDRNTTIAYLGELFGFDVEGFRKSEDEAALQGVAFNILTVAEDRSGGGDFNARLIDLASTSSQAMITAAKQDSANGALMRHALLGLSSFALSNPTGNIPSALNEVMSASRLDLDLYKSETGEGHITENWIKDRAEMLSWLMKANSSSSELTNSDGVISFNLSPFAIQDEYEYIDEKSNTEILVDSWYGNKHLVYFGDDDANVKSGFNESDRLYGGAGDDTLKGNDGSDYLQGDDGVDTLEGGTGNDTLNGMQGNDTLNGGKGDDTLYGGIGSDEYIFIKGDGTDTILDADDSGLIKIDEIIIKGGEKKGWNTWLSEDGNIKYTLRDGDLMIVPVNGAPRDIIYIKEFTSGNLGITLKEPAEEVPYTGVIVGDIEPTMVTKTREDGTTYETYDRDDFGNFIGVAGSQPRADEILGSTGEDEMHGGAENDSVYGNAGNDKLYGEANADLLGGGLGEDKLYGGDGNDIIHGDNGYYAANASGVVWTQSAQPPVEGAVFLDAGVGWIRYSATYDAMSGQSFSYANAISPVLHQLSDERFNTFTLIKDQLQPLRQLYGDADYIEAGQGDDIAYGDGGNDYIYGEAGKDTLYGGGGNDFIDGGADNDLIFGDDLVYAQFYFDSNSYLGRYKITTEVETYENEFGNDILAGGDGDDYIFGMAGSDIIMGEGGNDYLVGDFFEIVNIPILVPSEDGTSFVQDTTEHFEEAVQYHGNDHIDGGDGDDYIIGLAGDDALFGKAGKDFILGDGNSNEVRGLYGNDYLNGGDEDDFLQGSGGNDDLYGGTGNDKLWGDEYAGSNGSPISSWGSAPVNQGEGTADALSQDKHGQDNLYGEEGDDELIGGGFDDYLDGGAGNDKLYGDGEGVTEVGNDTLIGGEGNDQLQGYGGNDNLDGGDGVDALFGGDGNDVLQGGADNDYLTGEKDDDQLFGDAGDDRLDGDEGNDTLTGGAGLDYLLGGQGDDTYVFKVGDSQIINNTYEVIDDSDGQNSLVIEGGSVTSVRLVGSSDLIVNYSSNDGVYIKNGMNGAIAGFELQPGQVTDYDQLIANNLHDNVVRDANESNVYIVTGLGSDTVSVGDFSVVMTGKGNDSISATGSGNTFVYRVGDGSDTIAFTSGLTVENNVISFSDGISASDISLVVTSMNGADVLEIRTSNDANNVIRLTGFSREDVYSYKGVTSLEFADGSVIGLSELFEGGFKYPATESADSMMGTSLSDVMDGQGGNDTLLGLAGVDALSGGLGNDRLEGGDGDDRLDGGEGNDTLLGGLGADALFGGQGNDSLSGDAGADVYHYQLGDGNDIVSDYDTSSSNTDTILFGDQISVADVSVVRDAVSMALIIKGTAGVIRLDGQLGNSAQKIERIEFADGTVWSAEELLSMSTVGVLPVLGTVNSDQMTGTEGNDYLLGLEGNDTLNGAAGNDLLDGGAGVDTINGGIGEDVLYGLDGADTLNGNEDKDQLFGGDGDDKLNGGAGDDLLSGDDGLDRLYGGSGSDTLQGGAGIDHLYGEDGTDALLGGQGDDYYHLVGTDIASDVITELLGEGVDTVSIIRTGSLTYSLAENIENIDFEFPAYDTTSTVVVYGNSSDNGFQLTGTPLATIYGGMGNDVYTAALYSGQDQMQIIEYAGEGNDTVILRGAPGHLTFNSTYYLADNLENVISDLSGDGLVIYGNSLSNTVSGNSYSFYKERIYAGAGDDTVYGYGGDDTLDGQEGNDALYGGAGNDTLRSGGGVNLLDGGAGNDTYTCSGSVDTLISSSGNDSLYLGSGEANIILSGASNATVYAGSGQYSLDFRYSSLLDLRVSTSGGIMTVTYRSSAETDRTVTVATSSLGSLASVVTTDGAITGSAWFSWLHDNPANYTSNVTVGSTGAENIAGGRYDVSRSGESLWLRSVDGQGATYGSFSIANLTPADTDYAIEADGRLHWSTAGVAVVSLAIGDITLHAGTSASDDFTAFDKFGSSDWYVGNEGQDVYSFGSSSGSDVIDSVGAAGLNDVINISADVDPLMVSLFRDQDDLLLTTANGSSLSLRQYFISSSTSPLIVFADGTVWDDDSVYYYLYGATLGDDVIEGSELDDYLSGLDGNDSLNGGQGFDTLDGGRGNDFLDGGIDADIMIGGLGDDTYLVASIDDVTDEQSGEGIDLVLSSVTHTLSSNIENLTLTGTNAINGTGNILGNVLTGNSAANVLAGGAGNDTYYVSTGDTVTEGSNAGLDTIIADINWTLSSNVEDLRLAGSALTGTGNALANHLWGNDLNNTLNGGTGADILEGGAGNDLYVVDVAGDVVIEALNNGIDTVQTAITWTLAANIENLTLTGSGKANGTGNALDNRIVGTSSTNVLTGGKGNDTYVVTSGDTVTELASEGVDTIESAIAWTLGANIENLTLTGTGKVAGTGNTLDNILVGNSAVNTLKGGKGNDTYVVSAGDVVTEIANEGIDTIQSALTWTLGSNIENLTLTGTSAINGTGNTLANTLRGNSAANTLTGGSGNDIYQFGRGGGADIIVDTDSTAGNADLLTLDAGIAYDQLWFKHVGTALEVSVIGTSDKVTINNWYSSANNHVERIQTADGHYLIDTQIEQLVQAMAGMTGPGAGQTSLTTTQHQQLDTVFASTWQTA